MRQYGIIGHPLGHTLSPKLHNWGFAEHGLDASYEAWPTLPRDVDAFMSRFREEGMGGLSITIPHKRTVMDYADQLTDRAKAVGAINTLWWDGSVLVGDNTDVAGVVQPLRAMKMPLNSALVLGAGGASRAAVAACKELGVSRIGITNRTAVKAATLAEDFDILTVDWDARQGFAAELLINSTPLGMLGEMQDESPWQGGFEGVKVVFDLVYNPLNTRLLKEAAQAGCRTIQGLEMFLHQGLEQFRLWTGKELDPEGARNLLLKELGQ